MEAVESLGGECLVFSSPGYLLLKRDIYNTAQGGTVSLQAAKKQQQHNNPPTHTLFDCRCV